MRVLIGVTVTFASIAAAAFHAGSLSDPAPVAVPLPSVHARTMAAAPRLFETSHGCISCHNGLTTSTGEQVGIGSAWRATMMANSARDPYWQASVRREVLDHPEAREEIEDECSTCHMPMARYQAHADGRRGEVFAHLTSRAAKRGAAETRLATDGVSCTLCHQIRDDKLGTPESFVGGFFVDTTRRWGSREVFGPYEIDAGRRRIMHSSSEFVPTQGAHVRKSELCATCHTLYTNARDASGKVVARLPEQVPFLEWQHSDYGSERRAQSCQSCHMPAVAESTAISGVWGQPRPTLARHDFRGGNFFMLDMLDRRRDELGVEAPADEMRGAVRQTIEHLQSSSSRVTIETPSVADGRLRAEVVVRNLAGHKLPTAYPSRRVWIHFTVRDRSGAIVFESGAVQPNGAIVGNDNDRDETTFEPHRREISLASDVQIYESIMVDPAGRVTTGLLSAARFVEDNRLLPDGFDKRAAAADIAVRGDALDDDDFAAGSDRVRYVVPVPASGGPFRVDAELLYQPVAFRWARNLGRHDAAEIKRFVGYYDAMADASSVALAKATQSTP